MSTQEPGPPDPRSRQRAQHPVYAWIGAIVGVAGLAIAIWQAWPHHHHATVMDKAHPSLQLLQGDNRDLSQALKTLDAAAVGTHAMNVSGVTLGDLRAAKVKLAALKAKQPEEIEFKHRAAGVFAAEHTYLRAVRALLRQNASRLQRRSFRTYADDLRHRLRLLGTSVSYVSDDVVDGADVLSEWFHNKTHDASAIAQFPPAQQQAARKQIPPTRTPAPTSTTGTGSTGSAKVCANDQDDDGDGKQDFPDDPGCASADDDSESPDPAVTANECTDSMDNDGDGLTDGDDPGCTPAGATSEAAG